ncbi:peptidase M28-like protein [Lacinutrix venerupis]|uniref:M28 family metallopeptidase n=1 Tax=Lacinutrix venerupis TaxID=1486034 RepID=UPI000EAE7B5F|nr:M28 family metallopeptidase [Lacinutrix venerupis]RLJ68652.1 peptidase M28-like protein [Lacinutrix venerupis]
MKALIIASAFLVVGSCSETKYSTKIENLEHNVEIIDKELVLQYSKTITPQDLKSRLDIFCSEEFQGRATGKQGQKKASNYLRSFYKEKNIAPKVNDSTYYQTIPEDFLPKGMGASENILAYIKGSQYPEEVLIISGHLDHLGIKNDAIFFGADDNGSGTVAITEIAEAFKLAEQQGHSPKRSILFLHLTAEEIGLQGSKFYIENPVFNLDKTIANLNIDMIGRVDNKHENNTDYIYLIGADRISKELHYISAKTAQTFTNLELDYKYNSENDKNRYYYRSDHYNFAKKSIPVIFYFNGEHKDYHKPTDTPEKINYPLLAKRAKLIFATAWQLANRKDFLIKNEDI